MPCDGGTIACQTPLVLCVALSYLVEESHTKDQVPATENNRDMFGAATNPSHNFPAYERNRKRLLCLAIVAGPESQ